jgi:imidazolonepropionase-like amidohydrolase
MTTTFSASELARSPAGDEPWAIRPGRALLPSGEVRSGLEVVVAGDVITSVSRVGDGLIDPVHAIDVPEATLLPGLIDTHVHLTFSGDGKVVENVITESVPMQLARAAGNAQRALARGVTTAVDCGGKTEVVTALRDGIAAGGLRGPRLLVSGAPLTTTAGHCHWLGGCADSPDEVIREVRRLVASGVDIVKVMVTGGNTTPGSNPGQLQFDPEVVLAVGRECARLGKTLVAHAHTREAVALAAAAGAGVVAHATFADASGGVSASPETVAALVEARSYVDPTLMVGAVALPGSTPDHPSGRRMRLRSSMIPLFRDMHASGVPLLAGTDGGVPGVPHGSVAGAVVALHHEVGLDVGGALGAATSVAASAYGLSHEVGALAPGLRADLLLVDGLVDREIEAVSRPLAVWQAGELVASRGLVSYA